MAQTQLVLWDWNGTLLNDLQLSIQALNRLLAENGYPQQFDTRAYRKIFGFPIQDYYRRAGFDFSRHPYDRLAQRYMEMYIPASEGCRLSPRRKGCACAAAKTGDAAGDSVGFAAGPASPSGERAGSGRFL